MRNLSIYVHIPFCEVKCGYCDFFSVARGYEDFDLQHRYVTELIHEIDVRSRPFKGQNVHSIFFGGGTPSLLDPQLLESIFKALRTYFTWSSETEITLETNPKTVTLEKLKNFRSLGVNRVSMGVQSFEDKFLKVLGRIHSGDEAKKTIEEAHRAGFEKVSFDMIMALPGQTLDDWKKDIETALSFSPQHLSAYHLTIEEGTAFENLYRKGKLILPPEEDGVECLVWTRERLSQAGLEAYEISNFSKPGFECVHNRHYWNYGDYLGFGAGAASFIMASPQKQSSRMDVEVPAHQHPIMATRQSNVRDLKKYLARDWVGFVEALTYPMAMGEFCMLALRTREGISRKAFEGLFHQEIENVYKDVLEKYISRKYILRDQDDYTLTPSGLLFTDSIVSDFIF